MLDGARDARRLHNQVGARVACVEARTSARGNDLPSFARGDLQDLTSLFDRRGIDGQSASVVSRLERSARVGNVLLADDACERSSRPLRVESGARTRACVKRL